MAEHKKYYINVPGALVEVSEGVYFAYYQEKRRGRTLREKDERNGAVSYDGLDTPELTGQEMIPDRDAVSVEDAAIANILRGELRRCLALLDEPDRQLIQALYFEGLSERKYAKRVGIPQQTISDRKRRVLARLKKLLEN
jgi:RNA polymerase sigma factor (sigma-70 family)